MASPLDAVAASGGRDGTFFPAGLPTNPGGNPPSARAAAAPGGAIPAAPVQNARNNRGSNTTVPYSRLVPILGLEGELSAGGIGRRHGGGKVTSETDGLGGGHLAFVKGRTRAAGNSQDADHALSMRGSAHRGLGFGPDRLQRLCSWPYLETAFRVKFGGLFLRPDLITLSDLSGKSALVDDYVSVLGAASATDAPDVAWIVQNQLLGAATPEDTLYFDGGDLARLPVKKGPNAGDPDGFAEGAHLDGTNGVKSPETFGAEGEGFACGLFMLEPGPFLRGKMNTDAIAELPALGELFRVGAKKSLAAAPRSLGDAIAFDALYAEMASNGMFDWTPDGVVLSKLVDPTGDPLASAQIDARAAQLFNVAVAGPAICSSWSGVSAMACLPGDEVFVLIVADSAVCVGDVSQAEVKARRDQTNAAIAKVETHATTVRGNTPLGGTDLNDLAAQTRGNVNGAAGKGEIDAAFNAAKNEVAAPQSEADFDNQTTRPRNFSGFVDATTRYVVTRQAALKTDDDTLGDLQARCAVLEKRRNVYFEDTAADFVDNWQDVAEAARRGVVALTRATLCNFRLQLVTSSFLANNAGPGGKTPRCGLKRGTPGGDPVASVATAANLIPLCAEYYVGGWSVGKVLDAAASRTAIGAQVRTAPNSSAMNVNVDVKFVSGDELHRRFALPVVKQRGEPRAAATDTDGARAALGLAAKNELYWEEMSEVMKK